MGQRTDFVYREAADNAIVAGQWRATCHLLPRVLPIWLPELANVAGREGRDDIVTEIIACAQKSGTLDAKFNPLAYIQPIERPLYTQPSYLRKEAIRGATSVGRIDTIGKLAATDVSYAREHYFEAARAAIEFGQVPVLEAMLPHIEDRQTVRGLKELMGFALEKDNQAAIDTLLRVRGAAALEPTHLETLVAKDQQALFDRFLQALGTEGHIAGSAMSALIHRADLPKIPFPKTGYVAALWAKADEGTRLRSFSTLSFANQHDTIQTLLNLPAQGEPPRPPVSQEILDWGLQNAAAGYSQQTFDLLLPRATQAGCQKIFETLTTSDRSLKVHKLHHFVAALLGASTIAAETMETAAVKISNTEMHPDRNDQIVIPDPSAAVAILKDKNFTAASATSVLVRMGFSGNAPAIKAAIDAGADPLIADFYAAITAQDLETVTSLMRVVPYEALKSAAKECQYKSATAVTVLLVAGSLSQDDKDDQIGTLIYRKDYDTLATIFTKGPMVQPGYFKDAQDDATLQVLVTAAGGRMAAQVYLEELQSELAAAHETQRADWQGKIDRFVAHVSRSGESGLALRPPAL